MYPYNEVKLTNNVQAIILKFHKSLSLTKVNNILDEVEEKIKEEAFSCLSDIGRWVSKNSTIPHTKFNWVITDPS